MTAGGISIPVPRFVGGRPPEVVYRGFRLPQHADGLVAGFVWISTLEACRAYEERGRGDADEATLLYHTGTISGDGNSAALKEVARHAGIGISGGFKGRITIANVLARHIVRDALVLCTTERHDFGKLHEFGKHWVQISKPTSFFLHVAVALSKLYRLTGAGFGRVKYESRSSRGSMRLPEPIGFIKPPEEYQHQKEVRMLWDVEIIGALVPREIYCPPVSGLCKRLS